MASANKKKKVKSISSVLEELDKALYEGKWQDVRYILKKTEKKKPLPEVIWPFIQSLEYIEDYTMEKSTHSLNEIDELLRKAMDLCQEEDHSLVRTLIKIKQGQLAWINNEMEKALNRFPQVTSVRVDNAPIHTSKLFMESSLYTGLCTEVLHGDDPNKYNSAILAYEEAVRLALEIAGLSKNLSLMIHPSVFRTIRTSLERGPILCIKLSNPLRAAAFFRRILMSKEEHILPQIRQICATSLSICLLFLVSPSSYCPFTFSQSMYTPSQLSEELVLVTSLAKTFLGTLSDTKVEDASALFDIITLVLTNARLPNILVQTLEDSMPFVSAGPHLWLQFALSLVAAGGNLNQQAEAVFHECVRLFPKDPLTVLTASKFVLESLKPELCIKWIQNGLQSFTGHFLEPKIYFVLGEAQVVLAEKEMTYAKKQVLLKKSLNTFKQAMNLDPQNSDYIFRYAIQLAVAREISASMEFVQQALSISHDHPGCLHLLALLLSAMKQYSEALKICELALVEDPNNLNLIKTKISLQVIVQGPHQALQTCKQSLKVWQKLFSGDNTGLIGAITQDQRSLSDIQSKAVNRDELAYAMSPDILSDTGSSHFSLSTSPSLRSSTVIQAQIWCTIANVFIKCKKYTDASLCVQEAQYLAPYLPVVSITSGHVFESENHPELAMDQYNNALILRPHNVTALICIGKLLHLSGKNEEAEKHFREALSIDRLNHEAWYWLGKIFAGQNEHNNASDCFRTALQFESTCPIQKFEASLHREDVLI